MVIYWPGWDESRDERAAMARAIQQATRLPVAVVAVDERSRLDASAWPSIPRGLHVGYSGGGDRVRDAVARGLAVGAAYVDGWYANERAFGEQIGSGLPTVALASTQGERPLAAVVEVLAEGQRRAGEGWEVARGPSWLVGAFDGTHAQMRDLVPVASKILASLAGMR